MSTTSLLIVILLCAGSFGMVALIQNVERAETNNFRLYNLHCTVEKLTAVSVCSGIVLSTFWSLFKNTQSAFIFYPFFQLCQAFPLS